MKSTLIASVPWLCLALMTSYDIISFDWALSVGVITWVLSGIIIMMITAFDPYAYDLDEPPWIFWIFFNGSLLAAFLAAIISLAAIMSPAVCGDAENIEGQLTLKTKTLLVSPRQQQPLCLDGIVIDPPERLTNSSLRVVRVKVETGEDVPMTVLAFLDSTAWPNFSPRPGQKVGVRTRHLRAYQHSWYAPVGAKSYSVIYFVEPLEK